ncbi:MAG: epoxyqueuosine reductase QueH [Clostridiaceae bacterium]|nr:epoxyqueuosine reductase QueH [Clostridiaceae bacterium]
MKLLLHMCCAPCTVYPARVLKEEGIEFEGLFHNPNIHPFEEFTRRRENLEILAGINGLTVNYIDDFDQAGWEGFRGEGEERCRMCYSRRLEKAAQFASQEGFGAFTTTLLVSPYQKHDVIREIGENMAKKYGVGFYYRDFRPGFRKGQQLAREMGLYRQKYCGCIISLRDKQDKDKAKEMDKVREREKDKDKERSRDEDK